MTGRYWGIGAFCIASILALLVLGALVRSDVWEGAPPAAAQAPVPAWELVADGGRPGSLWRVRVPGGWVYGTHASITFVPEPPK